MAGHAGLLVELAPAQEVVAQRVGQGREELRHAGLIDQADQAVDIDEAGHGMAPCEPRPAPHPIRSTMAGPG